MNEISILKGGIATPDRSKPAILKLLLTNAPLANVARMGFCKGIMANHTALPTEDMKRQSIAKPDVLAHLFRVKRIADTITKEVEGKQRNRDGDCRE